MLTAKTQMVLPAAETYGAAGSENVDYVCFILFLIYFSII